MFYNALFQASPTVMYMSGWEGGKFGPVSLLKTPRDLPFVHKMLYFEPGDDDQKNFHWTVLE